MVLKFSLMACSFWNVIFYRLSNVLGYVMCRIFALSLGKCGCFFRFSSKRVWENGTLIYCIIVLIPVTVTSRWNVLFLWFFSDVPNNSFNYITNPCFPFLFLWSLNYLLTKALNFFSFRYTVLVNFWNFVDVSNPEFNRDKV